MEKEPCSTGITGVAQISTVVLCRVVSLWDPVNLVPEQATSIEVDQTASILQSLADGMMEVIG